MERAVEQDNRGVVRMTTLCAGLILLMLSLDLFVGYISGRRRAGTDR